MKQTARPIKNQTGLQQAAVRQNVGLSVWLDADSCPKELRPVLWRAAARLNQSTAADTAPNLCNGQNIQSIDKGDASIAFHIVAARPQCLAPFQKRANMYFHEVAPGPNAADRFIEAHCQSGDIVITRDIVFAQTLCIKDSALRIINDRGTEYTRDNVFARCRQSDLALGLRRANLLPQSTNRGTNRRRTKHTAQFAACFDKCIAQQMRKVRRQTAPKKTEQK